MKRLSAAMTAALLVVALASSTALAVKPASSPSLQFFHTHATAGWVSDGISSDGDGTSVKITTIANGPHGPSYAGFTAVGTALDTGSVTVSGITNLGFQMDSNYVGAGAPRFSIELSDGSVIYASAAHCGATTGDTTISYFQLVTFVTWGNGNAACTFYWTGSPISGGTWSDVVTAFPTQTVNKVQMVQDEGPSTVRLDEIQVQNCTFHYGGTGGATCN